MTTVHIEPLPSWARATKYKPLHPPVFPDSTPSDDDIELALALYAELDPESQAWYGGDGFVQWLRCRVR